MGWTTSLDNGYCSWEAYQKPPRSKISAIFLFIAEILRTFAPDRTVEE